MAQLQAILNYQSVDAKLYELEKVLAESEERKVYAKLQKFLKSAPEKLDSLEVKAQAFRAEADALATQYAKAEATLAEFDNLEEMVKGGADIAFYKKEAQKIFDQLKKIRADINALSANIKATDEEYQKLKKQVISAQKQYEEASNKYKELKESKAGERGEIEKQLKTIGKDISPEMLGKYQTKRKEKMFPVVGALNYGRCWFCGMEPPIAAQSKLGAGYECDNCHRIIFKED
ncbi:MAG: hypothetical protein E7368_03990 [Clostridiales bacterium]|nr:hypothetical protein [Clostridiales bacterium]